MTTRTAEPSPAPNGPPSVDDVAMAAVGVTVRFGGIMALSDVSFDVPHRSIVGLVGPNGAGKSTLLSVLSGLLSPRSGRVWLQGEDVTGISARARAGRGLARTFQQPELFAGLTVREHLILAYRARVSPQRLLRDMFDPRALFRSSTAEQERVDLLLDLLALTRVAETQAMALPLGTVRLVEVGRALAGGPNVVLLDEPLSGLDVKASENLLSVFSRVVSSAENALSLVIVEHDVAAVLALSEKVFVLDFGELIAVGTPDEVRRDPAVRSAYLGDSEPVARSIRHGTRDAP